MKSAKDRREWYLSHGICPQCGQADAQKGHTLCLSCLEYKREWARQKRARMTKEERKRARRGGAEKCKRRYHRLKEQGLCTQCGKRKPISGETLCLECKLKHHRSQDKHRSGGVPLIPRNEYTAYGMCYKCGAPLYTKGLCKRCYDSNSINADHRPMRMKKG